MKKNNIIVIITIIVVLVVLLALVFIFLKPTDAVDSITPVEPVIKNEDFIYIESEDKYSNEELKDIVFTSLEEYHSRFNNDLLTEKDFENNNYLLLSVFYDECSEKNITPTSYTINGTDVNVVFKYESSCGICAPSYLYYLLKLDKNITSVKTNIKYESINDPHCDPNVAYKPMIYIYPESEMEVSVKLGKPELLTSVYPKYNNGWNALASPNGDLKINGRTYYGLYWEGKINIDNNYNDGFVVKREDTVSFLESKLSILGLNEREANEFIVYWLPILESSKYNFIRFESMEVINREMPLEVTPVPDTMIRVLMEYKPLNEKIEVLVQKLIPQERHGYSVIEWGGTLLK